MGRDYRFIWQGVQASIPDAFADPKQFLIQKGIGVSTLHEVLPEVVELVRYNGKAVAEKNS